MSDKNYRIKCNVCDWVGGGNELLYAPHPFLAEESIAGCPACKECFGFSRACDLPECDEETYCGIPTESGYQHRCYKHMKR